MTLTAGMLFSINLGIILIYILYYERIPGITPYQFFITV
uniref:MFS transporter n=1 Tax=Brugia pahangi TaxID=6280 RepID=A0A0N4TI48_BRUPA